MTYRVFEEPLPAPPGLTLDEWIEWFRATYEFTPPSCPQCASDLVEFIGLSRHLALWKCWGNCGSFFPTMWPESTQLRRGQRIKVTNGQWKDHEGTVLGLERDEVTIQCSDGGQFHTKQANVEVL